MRRLAFLALFLVLAVSLRAQQPPAMAGLAARMEDYYRDPANTDAVRLLELTLAADDFADAESEGRARLDATACFFGLLAAKDDALPAQCEKAFPAATRGQRLFLLKVLWFSGRSDPARFLTFAQDQKEYAGEAAEIRKTLESLPGKFDPLSAPVENPADINLLWVAFFATGDRRLPNRVIDLLVQPDLCSERLVAHLKAAPADAPQPEWVATFPRLGVDWSARKVAPEEDLDPLLPELLATPSLAHGVAQGLVDALKLENADRLRLSVKSEARASLAEYAPRHGIVLELLRERAATARDGAVSGLLRVQLDAYEALGDSRSALEVLSALRRRLPRRRELAQRQFETLLEIGAVKSAEKLLEETPDFLAHPENKRWIALAALMETTPPSAASVAKEKPADLAQAALRAVAAETSHVSMLRLRAVDPKDSRRTGEIEWRFRRVAPDRFDVRQKVKLGPDRAHDRWISVGKDSWSLVKMWYRDETTPRGDLNRFLGPDKWTELLKTAKFEKAQKADDATGGAGEFRVLTAKEASAPADLGLFLRSGKKVADVEIWIDPVNGRISRAALTATVENGKDQIPMRVEQVFIEHDQAGNIEPPTAR